VHNLRMYLVNMPQGVNMLKLYFVTVPTLVDFYKSQNQLAAEGARTQASLETQAALSREEMSANKAIANKRLAQEAQLEQYKQQMENLRSARDLSSRERQALTEQLQKEMQAALGRKTQIEQTELTQKGAAERQQVELQAGAPKRQAETEATQQLAQARAEQRPVALQKLQAEAQLAKERSLIASSPDLQGIMTEVKQFNDQKGQLKNTLGKDGYNNMLKVLQQRAQTLGVDLTHDQNYLEATQEARKESVEKVKQSLATFADEAIQKGAIQRFLGAKMQLLDEAAKGYPPDQLLQRKKNLIAFAKKNGIPDNYLQGV